MSQNTLIEKRVLKPTPGDLLLNRGDGTNFETRPSALGGFLTSNERFFVRSSNPTPEIDAKTWRLRIDGSGVRRPAELRYDQIASLPQATVTRVIQCAGNGRQFFRERFGKEGEGIQWRTGAIGCAEWTGVRLREVLQQAGLTEGARDVMPESLDEKRIKRPMPLAKALADDTLLVLKMNGEPLPPDHGFPLRVLVSGWTGSASIKWLGRIQVSEEPLFSGYNTENYVMIGPDYEPQPPALGPAITSMPINSLIDWDWPAQVAAGECTVRGRAFAGESLVSRVEYRIDQGEWQEAELLPPHIAGAWVCWRFAWRAVPGRHEIRVRATDQRGICQPETVPWNVHGYLYNAVTAHPVTVF